MKSLLPIFLTFSMFLSPAVQAETQYEVIDGTYSACTTEAQYRQLLSWSLYGVGKKPEQGCAKAPAKAKAIIIECPESDIILCRFRLTPADGSPSYEIWASKVMLKEIP